MHPNKPMAWLPYVRRHDKGHASFMCAPRVHVVSINQSINQTFISGSKATVRLRCCSIWLCEIASDFVYRVDLLHHCPLPQFQPSRFNHIWRVNKMMTYSRKQRRALLFPLKFNLAASTEIKW